VSDLKARIEAKARRTATLPIQVGDVAAAAADVQTVRGALELRQQQLKEQRLAGVDVDPASDDRLVQLLEQLGAALQRQADTVVPVKLQALDPDAWDAVLDSIEPDEEGSIDLTEVRATLLAASAVDEDLRDETWWAEQLARPEWSKGDRLAINNLLLELNLHVPSEAAGKG